MKKNTAVLIIDNEKDVCDTLAAVFEDEGMAVFSAGDAATGIKLIEEKPIAVVFLEVTLPVMGGIEVLEKIKKTFSGVEVIMMSERANINIAVRTIKAGAFDFLEKPLSIEKALVALRNAQNMSRLREENIMLKKQRKREERIIGDSPAIQKVKDVIDHAAGTDARILITGENGTGKELVARAIHRASKRKDGPFIAVNCAAIPDTLIESELFGHEKGAFTDASSLRKGRFEMANGGTLFLDEIADMSLSAQAKMLRVIQEQKIERLGGERTITVDVRIVSATNKDLVRECKAQRFREDLFFRLNVIPVHVPALCERREDIIPILKYFLSEAVPSGVVLSREAEQMLVEREWSGNVRELKNIAERIALFLPDHGDTALIDINVLRSVSEMAGKNEENTRQKTADYDILDKSYGEAKAAFERQYLEYHLAKNGGALTKTAEEIGVFPSNLHIKLRKTGLL
ncbi:MAG: sigma-54 dependent transcriptional regulator [Spirochaetaceae bacterium]|jgi:two-component system nitrogen regulation response regulator NtrX|nr:sigma-54 dependent transcriptional regulator [Spirochaetaceae bacterium]